MPYNTPLEQVVSVLVRIGQRPQAKALLDTFATLAATFEQYDEIAYLYTTHRYYTDALPFLDRAVAIAPTPDAQYSTRANLAKVLNHNNEPHMSLMYSHINASHVPGDVETMLEIGFSYYLMGDYAKGRQMMEELLITPLSSAERERVLYNLGTYKMDAGDFTQGLHDLVTYGHAMGILPVRTVAGVPKWNGFPEAGKTLYILAEGGIGDELIGIRFYQHVEALGMRPIWITNHDELLPVFTRHGLRCQTQADPVVVANAYYVQAFYLPVLMELERHELWDGPYLTPDPIFIEKWRDRLPAGRKIAVKWYGNQAYEHDLHRTLPLEQVEALSSYGTLISVQLEGYTGDRMMDYGPEITCIEDTLAIISLCDMTVTSCTSLVHMMGAMGLPGMVCPPISSYYCWLGREDARSDWYGDNLAVFRQTIHKNWDTVFTRVHARFHELGYDIRV